MTQTYRTDDLARWGAGQGFNLSPAQVDNNFWDLIQRMIAQEARPDPSAGIAYFEVVGIMMYVHMTDGSVLGPYELPVATFRDRGVWTPETVYSKMDTFSINGGLYVVVFDHTSGTTFDAGANDGAGNDYYQLMIQTPGSSIPIGGVVGQLVVKTTTTDYAVGWGYTDASVVSFEPSTGSGLSSTNVADALEEVEANIGGASMALHNLSDVNVTEGPGINGYALTWNNTSSKWVAASSTNNLSGMADVNVTEGPGINGYFLQWNNATSKWIAAASSNALSGLTDVNVTEGPGINGYFLKWDNGTSKWIASTSALSGLADVNVTEGSGINGYFLKWDNASSKWVASLTGATAVALSSLTDVNVTEGPGINGYFLQWNNATSKWIAAAALVASNNLSDVASASTARTNLGLAIGTNVQAYDAQLSSLVRQNSQSTNYTTVLTDGGKHILHPSADTTARTFTIDSNANVAYPLGTAITFVNQNAGGAITIAITSDTMRLAGAGTTGSRTLAANGVATALKIAAAEWIISGTNLT